MQKKRILITGASGFIGSTIVDKAIELGYEVWAGVRRNSSREYLKDKRIHFVEFKYSSKDELRSQLIDFKSNNGIFDYIVHSAGLTKAVDKSAFYDVNYLQVKNFVDVLVECDMVPALFVFMSSLGVLGPGDETGYSPFLQDATPNPNTEYGKSKLMAEAYIKSVSNFPYLILRPTGVYGPRDRDYLILMRAIKNRINVGAGFKKQLLSFMYVEDLASIIFRAIDRRVSMRGYNISDGDAYTDTEFNAMVQDMLNIKWSISFKVPLAIVRPAAYVSEKVAKIIGKATTFNTDKYKIMKQRNWACDISTMKQELDFEPQYKLKEGVEKTVSWYKSMGWL
mgnify:CR=1 FL=1